MEKKNEKKVLIARVGGNLKDGRRFEAGDNLALLKPSKKELDALRKLEAIEEEN